MEQSEVRDAGEKGKQTLTSVQELSANTHCYQLLLNCPVPTYTSLHPINLVLHNGQSVTSTSHRGTDGIACRDASTLRAVIIGVNNTQWETGLWNFPIHPASASCMENPPSSFAPLEPFPYLP